ncbi:unnamed protein product [Parnassius apollo]|uniref:(apollo) hypothetical protein n=1 Tax=Parnassius apollo TaxID=110799 RepID=A0A8S3X4B3_PARAO|nr:unnamed protein product [Parnassius apollo]
MKHSGENGESSCIKNDGHILVTSNMEQGNDARKYNSPKNSTPQEKVINVCRICLATDRIMYTLYRSSLRTVYENCTGLKVNLTDGLPKMLCWECRHRLVSCRKFLDRAKHADLMLRKLIGDGCYLSFKKLKSIDTQKVKSNLIQSIHPPNNCDINMLEVSQLEDTNIQTETDIQTNSLKCTETLTKTDVKEGIIDDSNEQANFEQSETYSPEYLEEYELDMRESDTDLNEDDSKDPTQLIETPTKTETKEEIYCESNEHPNSRQSEYYSPEYLIDYEIDMKESDLDQNNGSIDTIRYMETSIETGANEEIINEFDTNPPEYLTDSETDMKETVSIRPVEHVEIPIETDELTNLGQSEIDSLESMTDDGLDINETVLEYVSTDTKGREIKNAKLHARNKMQKENMNGTNVITKRRSKATVLDPAMFTVIDLSYGEQIREIQKRKESDNYKYSHFKCTECFKGFLEEDIYMLHMLRHSNKYGTYVCGICKVHFSKLWKLRKHITIHAQKFRCKLCPYVTTGRQTAKMHEDYHNGQTYKCPQCPETFVKFTTYLSHVRLKHPSEFVCELCGNSFIGKTGLAQHKKLKHRFDGLEPTEDGLSCEECDIQFASESALKKHLKLSRRHKDSSRLEQEVLNRQRRTDCDTLSDNGESSNDKRNSGKKGKRDSELETPISCEQCEMQLPDYTSYYRHFRSAHPDKNRTNYASKETHYMCEVCGRMFKSPALLNDHSLVHSGLKQFECPQCHKVFPRRYSLVNHRRLHRRPKSTHQCGVCNKTFSNAFNLKRHRMIHTGLKPFKCEVCEKCFKDLPEKRLHFTYVHLKKPWPKRTRKKSTKSQQVSDAHH